MLWRLSMGLSLILTVAAGGIGAEVKPQTIAVVDFANRNPGDDWDWLEKGFSDLLITDLARSEKLVVVERERMHAILQEIRLGRSGLVDDATAQQVGRILAASKVLAGSYRVTGAEIEIEVHIVDVATARLTRVEIIRGKAEKVLSLEKQVALSLLDRLEVSVTPAQLAAIQRLAADSLDAVRHHYLALDYMDQGLLYHALREVLAARLRDRRFVKSTCLARLPQFEEKKKCICLASA